MMIIWRRGWIGGAVAVLVLLPILLSGCGAGAPARGGAALPHLEATLRLVPLNTGASGGQVALSSRWRRAVVLAGGTLSLVDLDQARVLGALATGRTAVGGSGGPPGPALLALDERRGRADVVRSGMAGQRPDLLIVAVTSGRLLTRTLLDAPPGALVSALGVAAHRGSLLVALTPGGLGILWGSAPLSRLARLLEVGADGRTRRAADLPFTAATLIVDEPRDRVLVAAPGAADLVGLDMGHLAQRWRHAGPYAALSTAYDPRRGRLWLLAPGGRATVLAARDGHVVATIPLSAARPADWRQGTDLTVDGATGAAYVSWCTGGGTAPRCGLDRLDPGRGTRTTVASVGGLLLGLDPVHGLALLQDMAGTVQATWIGPAQGGAAPIPLSTALGAGSGTRTLEVPIAAAAWDARAAVATPDGLLLALDTILPLHDDVTNAPTTDGLVLINVAVPPPRGISRGPPDWEDGALTRGGRLCLRWSWTAPRVPERPRRAVVRPPEPT